MEDSAAGHATNSRQVAQGAARRKTGGQNGQSTVLKVDAKRGLELVESVQTVKNDDAPADQGTRTSSA
ncbi:hypothetical protein NDU88_007907 [Pleurodeles waltl]|uniref:Uncharacterized protein n=1 Tax=Pleurodeles waltl TaxID=8319 RepID=A0AAV7NXC4_PLEWA|nr:hypothetical protein NDU88_007907 [Pleurodeles waltl]